MNLMLKGRMNTWDRQRSSRRRGGRSRGGCNTSALLGWRGCRASSSLASARRPSFLSSPAYVRMLLIVSGCSGPSPFTANSGWSRLAAWRVADVHERAV